MTGHNRYKRRVHTGAAYEPRLFQLQHESLGTVYLMGSCHDHVMEITPQLKDIIQNCQFFAPESTDTMLVLMKKTGESPDQIGIDFQLTRYAVEHTEGVTVLPLESYEEQQIAGAQKDRERAEQQELHSSSNITSMREGSESEPASSEAYTDEQLDSGRMIPRNKRMVERLLDRLRPVAHKSAFVVIGDNHLAGSGGVIQLFEQLGFACKHVALEKGPQPLLG